MRGGKKEQGQFAKFQFKKKSINLQILIQSTELPNAGVKKCSRNQRSKWHFPNLP